MKLRVPPGCGSVSYRGCPLAIDSDRTIEVDETAAGILAAHGFGSGLLSETKPQCELERRDEIAELNRSGLFALLRSKGVSVALPITNNALRAAARKALERPAE